MLDVEVRNEGTIIMVTPVSIEAKDWVEENVPLESWQWLGGAFAVEPQYVADLLIGMNESGLAVPLVSSTIIGEIDELGE